MTAEQYQEILDKDQINGQEIELLLEARKQNLIDFSLVDVREWMEWNQKRIVGTDYLVPTTSFYNSIEQIEDKKDKNIILYCFTGSRSYQCQHVMKNMGFKHVSNHIEGIISYSGECKSGEEE
jgi:rhodanese-related sulfurtransferase